MGLVVAGCGVLMEKTSSNLRLDFMTNLKFTEAMLLVMRDNSQHLFSFVRKRKNVMGFEVIFLRPVKRCRNSTSAVRHQIHGSNPQVI